MNLFETTTELKDIPLGFRLQRLEVYNWGTFDQKVWTLELAGDTSLLTGDVGSGKSTLVDAIITLLVPPRKVTYNKAADASAKERSLASYVRGYYGQKRTEDGGGRPEALRGKDQYSVVLGVFSDRNFGRTVTLAQVFWFPDEAAASPKRFYVLAQ
ncbi:ATP-binding protein [Selenomonas sp.]|nr:ATP-binding protein [Selenomonas sp.]MBQ1868472.1 AAA family ATPase [Selenomonas sp.]